MSMYEMRAASPRGPRKVKRYDCGSHGRLTVKQIADLTGLAEGSIRNRLALGRRGEELCVPRVVRAPHQVVQYRGREVRTTGNLGIAVACRIARAFSDREPTVDALRSMFDMSRATAYRWRRAWLDANGVAA